APKLVAATGQEQTTAVDDTEARYIAVMGEVEPDIALRLLAAAGDRRRPAQDAALRQHDAGIGVGESQRRMRRRHALRPAPAGIAGMGAAIHDEALAPDAHLEGQRAGMGMGVEARL